MAVKLRLQRFGSKKRPYYRLVVTDAPNPRNGRFIEIIGFYQPIEDNKLKIDEEKALAWLNKGAQPTDTVKSLFRKFGINEKFAKQKQVKVDE